MENIKFDPPPPLSPREVLPVIDYTGRLYGKKSNSEFLERGTVKGAALFMDGI